MKIAHATRAAEVAEAFDHDAIEGQQVNRAFLDRLHAARVQPADLAAVVAYAHFELLHAVCQLVRKWLVVRHG